ncbi:MAG: ATP-binding protein [Endomicrobiaceae bacterium]|nr:ATP-binding protein [Endomicrobiaceae bacterium]
MLDIRINNPLRKEWKKRNDRKKLRNRLHRVHGKKQAFHSKERFKKIESFSPPTILSVRKNPEATIKFFNNILEKVKKINIMHTEIQTYVIHIEMQCVMEITEDALMYLLTIAKNSRLRAKKKTILWRINSPTDKKAKEYLQNSGFIIFFEQHQSIDTIECVDNMNITHGTNVDTEVMKKVCDFVKEKSNESVSTKFLYKMLTELMSNTTQHAYTNSNITFFHSWYIFLEKHENIMRVTFMDNGLGIPNTIRKKNTEKILKICGIMSEHKLVFSALKGEFRSETKNKNRGKGLPEIYEPSLNGNIKDLTIISNKAFYSEKNGQDLKNSLNGTMFYWKIECMKGENNEN